MPPEPASLLRWAFLSPMRLGLVSILVAGTIVTCVLLTAGAQQGTHAAEPAPGPSSRHSVPPPKPSISIPQPGESLDGTASRRIRITARTFVDAWAIDAHSTTKARWLRTVRPLTTASLYRGLQATDLARLPGGQIERVQLEQIGPFAASAIVTLTNELQVRVELVTDNNAWVVADLRPVGT